LWRRVFNPKVRAWRAQFYPEIEDWSAYKNWTNPVPKGAG
jgi:alkane 1-monooxygenase